MIRKDRWQQNLPIPGRQKFEHFFHPSRAHPYCTGIVIVLDEIPSLAYQFKFPDTIA